MARHAALVSELESTVGDNAVRVVVLHAPRGAGVSHVLRAFVEEVRGWGHRAEYTDAEVVGVQAGGGVDALLRARLKLTPGASADEVLAALDLHEGIEPLAREFLAGALGVLRDDFDTARLDARSRWEGALSEIGRWLGQGEGAFAWVVDEAVALDAESLGLVHWLAQSARFPGLVVLSLRDDERAVFESRVKSLRMSGRFHELSLPPADAETLERAFPHTGRLARGLPLTARLLQQVPREFVLPVTLEAALRELHAGLSPVEQQVVGCLSCGGGRLPLAALDAALGGPQRAVVQELEQRQLLRRAPTERNRGADEVWLRFSTAAPPVESARAKAWQAALRAWAEAELVQAPRPAYEAMLLPLIIRGAEVAGDSARASLAWELASRRSGAVYGLRRAESTALGVRRLVLSRMLAEDELARGEAAQAVKTVQAAFRLSAPPLGGARDADPAVLRAITEELDRWDTLTNEEAALALELTRAEAHARLGQLDEVRRAFSSVQQRLEALEAGSASAALWLRLGHAWASFALTTLGDAAEAVRVCDVVRARVGEEALARSTHAVAFLRTEQLAQASGDSARARRLADELIQLTRVRGDAREECVAWSARAALHLRDGAVFAARDGFEKSLALARRIGFRRREAMAMHSLGLTLAHLGEYGSALAAQERYVALSEQVAHHEARAWGPAGMALVYVQQLDVHRAELAITRARKGAEENGWPVLLAWARHLAGLLKLLRHLERRDTLQLSLARADFLASLDLLEDHKAGWSESLDPAEPAACLGLTWLCAGNTKQAAAALPRARAWSKVSAHSARVVDALQALVQREPPEAAVRWFDDSNCVRSAELWRRVATHLDLAVPVGEDERARL